MFFPGRCDSGNSLLYQQTKMANSETATLLEPITQYPLPLKHEKNKIGCILIAGLFLLIVGIWMSIANGQVVQQILEYDISCEIQEGTFNQTCTFNHTITADMTKPVYLYYSLTKFYQNHREYVIASESSQLRGLFDSECDSDSLNLGSDGKPLLPCGYQGWSYFNDEVELSINSGVSSTCCDIIGDNVCTAKNDIALVPDVEIRFAGADKESDSASKYSKTVDSYLEYRGDITIPNLDDPSLMVWMRLAAGKDFKKIHSVIDYDLKEGDVLQFQILNKFNPKPYDGSKKFILSTTSTFGGKQNVLSVTFMLCGALTVFSLSVIMAVHAYMSKLSRNQV